MGRIVESLKKIYTANGGQASAVAGKGTISGVLDKIAGLSLGGGGDFVVTYKEKGSGYEADKSLDDLVAAVKAGKTVRAIFTSEGGDFGMTLCQSVFVEGASVVAFSCVMIVSEAPTLFVIAHMDVGAGATINMSSATLAVANG